MNKSILRWVGAGAVVLLPKVAHAFCGFYVSGADAKLFNNATQVVMMREGTRTVLSMQNNYQGPPENFAMVVPVPVVLQKENVKTLPRDIFDKVDTLTSPRLVEYWEQDPCMPDMVEDEKAAMPMPMMAPAAAPPMGAASYGVKIEAQFTVGEYEVVILSARDSNGLDRWLRDNKYKIPSGAEPYLRPYVQKGSKFFVAKVDVSKVKFERIGNGPEQAVLSPLRFHYDSDTFELPIRLGLINSAGTQDLIVDVLARGQRYEVANYDNVFIPTNIDVGEDAKGQFAAFYTALFDKTVATHPRAVVTEYAWDANSCDPCPTPGLQPNELATLGADVLPSSAPQPIPAPPPPVVQSKPKPGARPPKNPPPPPLMPRPMPYWRGGDFVVTRLHARYTREALGDDLIFRAAPPIEGGREQWGENQKLEKGAVPGSVNNFQARYAIRHPWKGAIACEKPRRGIWGGPPEGQSGIAGGVEPAPKIAYAPRGNVQLGIMVKEDVPEIGLKAGEISPAPGPAGSASAGVPVEKNARGCAGCEVGGGGAGAAGGIGTMLMLAAARLRRRRQKR